MGNGTHGAEQAVSVQLGGEQEEEEEEGLDLEVGGRCKGNECKTWAVLSTSPVGYCSPSGIMGCSLLLDGGGTGWTCLIFSGRRMERAGALFDVTSATLSIENTEY